MYNFLDQLLKRTINLPAAHVPELSALVYFSVSAREISQKNVITNDINCRPIYHLIYLFIFNYSSTSILIKERFHGRSASCDFDRV